MIVSSRSRRGRNWRKDDGKGKFAFWAILLFVLFLVVPSTVPQLSLLPVSATLLLLPLGNWVDRHRPLTARARRMDSGLISI